jgi:hypothetical protein
MLIGVQRTQAGNGEQPSGQPRPPATSTRRSTSATRARTDSAPPAMLPTYWTELSSGCRTSGSACTGSSRLPRDRAMASSAVHHTDATGRGQKADHGVGPPQPLVQPPVPLLTGHEAVGQILIEERLVAVVDEPTVHLRGERRVLARMADEDPCHAAPPLGKSAVLIQRAVQPGQRHGHRERSDGEALVIQRAAIQLRP